MRMIIMSVIQQSPNYIRQNSTNLYSKKNVEISQELLGPLTMSINEVLSDFASEFRGADPGLAGLGVVACFRMARGASSARKGWRDATQCGRIGDAWGRNQSLLKCAKGAFKAMSGAVFTVAKGLSIA